MFRKSKRLGWMLAALSLPVIMLQGGAQAGVPQPGIVLYGQVSDDQGIQLFDGELTFSYTPAMGGDSVQISARLRSIDGPGGPYSYRALLPFEAASEAFPASGDAVPVTMDAVEYVREGQVTGTSVVMSHNIFLSTGDISSAQRVDVCVGCDPIVKTVHSADTNEDYRFSLSEFLRVVEFYRATPGHDYHVNPATRDGYAVGQGPKTGYPHTGDYIEGADWKVNVNELLRMIDLFTSTPDHAYTMNLESEDGFEKILNNKAAKGAKSSAPTSLTMKRTISGGAVGAGSVLDFTLQVDGHVTDGLSGMAVTESLPAGWTVVGTDPGAGTIIAPEAGDGGSVDFAWMQTPVVPYTTSYQVAYAPGSNVGADYNTLTGTGFYRTPTSFGEFRVALDAGAEDADTDGDGILDFFESGADADGDGIPNFIDIDSDNDGLSDDFEAGYDGNSEDLDPMDPVNNPGGGDLDPYNPDTDGDGIADGDEIYHGTDPVTPTGKAAVPIGSAGFVGALALAGVLALRRRRG
jgi:MYXO-CTERM domain-containing protein